MSIDEEVGVGVDAGVVEAAGVAKLVESINIGVSVGVNDGVVEAAEVDAGNVDVDKDGGIDDGQDAALTKSRTLPVRDDA